MERDFVVGGSQERSYGVEGGALWGVGAGDVVGGAVLGEAGGDDGPVA